MSLIGTNDFENRVEEHLALALMDHYRARLAQKHGRQRLAQRWLAEMRTRLDRNLAVTLINAESAFQERRRAFEKCASSVRSHDSVFRQVMTQHVAEAFGMPELHYGLDEADTAAFWLRAAALVDDCLAERGTERDVPALTAPEPPEEVIDAVLGRFVGDGAPACRQPHARHVLILDDDVAALEPALLEANFRVIQASASELSGDELEAALGHRILVTRKTHDRYIQHAPIYEYGILGLDALPSIDPAQSFDTNVTAQLLSRAFLEHQLGFELSFVLMLHPQGRNAFRRLQ